MMKKTLTGIAVGAALISGGTVDLIDAPITAKAWAQYKVSEYTPTWMEKTATGTVEHIQDVPNFKDTDRNGLISYAIATNRKGQRVYSQITDEAYAKLGQRDGSRFNLDYPAVDKITVAEAIMEGLMPNVAEAAIAFDAFTNGGYVNPGNSITFAHTVSGSDRLLFAGTWASSGSGSFTMTYNGDAGTLANSVTDPDGNVEAVLYLKNPDTGTNNVVFGKTGGTYMFVVASSYTGTDQTTQPDSTATYSGTVTSSPWQLSTTITTIADNSWVFGVGREGADGNLNAVSGVIERGGTSGWFQGFDTNGAKTPAGTVTMVLGTTATRNWPYGIVWVSFKPSTGGGGITPSPIIEPIITWW